MYIKINNGQAEPYSIAALRNAYPNVSFPKEMGDELLAEYSVYPVTRLGAPIFDIATEKLVRNTPSLIGDIWTETWSVVSLTDEERAARSASLSAKVRKQRNEILSSTDWTQIADAPVDQAAWANYRQSLRDITLQEGFPYSIVWPTKPIA